jgi:hypothetical protein
MAIKHKYSASTTTVVSMAATLANAANTYTGLTGCTMNALDNSSDKYPDAKFVLEIPDTFAAAPTAGSTIDVYMSLENVVSTSDEVPLPAATDILYLAKRVASFVMDNQDVATIKTVIVRDVLYGVENALFYLYNGCGQQLSYSSNPITLKVTPLTVEDV